MAGFPDRGRAPPCGGGSVRAPAQLEQPVGGEAPSPLAAEVVDLLDAWVAADAPQLDADDDGFNDEAGPTITEALWGPLVKAAMRPVFGELTEALDEILDLGGSSDSGNAGSGLIDKDLRTLLGREVQGKFNLSYCGNGSPDECREELWRVVDEVAQTLANERGDDPSTWLNEGTRISFTPDLIPETMRATNRPTFQQVLEFVPHSDAGEDG